MESTKTFEGVPGSWQKTFNEKGISEDMLDLVVEFLADIGALEYCGTQTGCDGKCPSGQQCSRVGKNCICKK